MDDKHKKTWQEGYDAYLAGRHESDNPYKRDAYRAIWADGFFSAMGDD